jgi:apolipoprotein D and lipocalin family protein
MRRPLIFAVVAVAGIALTACVTSSRPASGPGVIAPQPAKPVDDVFFTGIWHEIIRNPMSITDGCVVGETGFQRRADGGLFQRDTCRMGSAAGKEKVIAGPVTLLDPAARSKFRTDYQLFGFIPIRREYWVLDHAPGWFIMATPDMKNLIGYTRAPPTQVTRAQADELAARARALGYAGALEFPDHPAP